MSSGLLVILMLGGLLCGWALLSVMGSERQRLLAELEAKRPKPAPPATPSASAPSARPATKSPSPKAAARDGAAPSKTNRVEKNAR